MNDEKIAIIDGNSLIYRAFYGSSYNREIMRSSDGTPTNALYTFIRMIEPIIVNFDYVLIAGDSRTPTFRHEKYQKLQSYPF